MGRVVLSIVASLFLVVALGGAIYETGQGFLADEKRGAQNEQGKLLLIEGYHRQCLEKYRTPARVDVRGVFLGCEPR